MSRIVNVLEMRELESKTMKELNIDEAQLMLKAGKALAEDFLARVKPEKNKQILVVANVGNNGGDSLVVTRELIIQNYSVKVLVVGDLNKMSDSFKYYFDDKIEYFILDKKEKLKEAKLLLDGAKYIIDGIFGIGLKNEVTGLYASIINHINGLKKVVYSIDIPSGLSPENGKSLNVAINASYTGVIGNYKLGNLLNDALDYSGEIKVLDIGLVDSESEKMVFLDYHEVDVTPMPRIHNSHKYTYGLGLFIGGNRTMMGSIQMAAMSGLKSGLGIARVLYEETNAQMTQFYPELIMQGINKYEMIKSLMPKAKTICFGPGMEKNSPMFGRALDHLIKKDIPILIDADGLEYINLHQELETNYCIVTPHTGELARLFSVSTEDIVIDPIKYIKQLTEKGYTVLYKGPSTIIADKEHLYILQAKNPGLAKAGSGDCLSGIISAYMVNNKPIDAAIKGMALHCLAADEARKNKGIFSMSASDIIDSISSVLKELS